DSKDLSFQLAEALAQRHVEAVEDDAAQLVRIVARGNTDARQRGRVLALVGAVHFQAPGAYRPPRRFAMARMAPEDVLQALPLDHGDRKSTRLNSSQVKSRMPSSA